jgi:hypothetical protein
VRTKSSSTNGTASFTTPRTGDVFIDVAALLRVALRELELAGHGACTLAGKVGDAAELAKRLAQSPAMPSRRGQEKAPPAPPPPVKERAETARVAISVGTLDAMLAAVKALGLTCKTSSTGTIRKALQAVVEQAKPAPQPQEKVTSVPPTPPADTATPLSTRQALKLGKDALVKLATKLGVPTGDLTARGTAMKLAAAVSKASGYAAGDKATTTASKPAAASSPPPAGTVFIADCKGGYRSPTAADAPALLALLDLLTQPAAA